MIIKKIETTVVEEAGEEGGEGGEEGEEDGEGEEEGEEGGEGGEEAVEGAGLSLDPLEEGGHKVVQEFFHNILVAAVLMLEGQGWPPTTRLQVLLHSALETLATLVAQGMEGARHPSLIHSPSTSISSRRISLARK